MLNCSDANSLFELGFGASAGIALLNERVRNARALFFERYTQALAEHRPEFNKEALNEPGVHSLILAGLPRFRLLLDLSRLIEAAAGLAVVIALATLLQLAHWGALCKLESSSLIAYCSFAFVVLPVVYAAYPWFVEHATAAAIQKTIHESLPLVAEILSDRQLRERRSQLLATAAELASRMLAAAHAAQPMDEIKAQLAKVQTELESMAESAEASSAKVLDEFHKAMRRDA